jgi:hypothetical protein
MEKLSAKQRARWPAFADERGAPGVQPPTPEVTSSA